MDERLIWDMFGLMSGPFAGSGAGDIGTGVDSGEDINNNCEVVIGEFGYVAGICCDAGSAGSIPAAGQMFA